MKEAYLSKMLTKEIRKNKKVSYYNITASQFSRRGWPDMLLLIRPGLMTGVELKVGKNKMSLDQETIAKEFYDLGFPFFCVTYDKIMVVEPSNCMGKVEIGKTIRKSVLDFRDTLNYIIDCTETHYAEKRVQLI